MKTRTAATGCLLSVIAALGLGTSAAAAAPLTGEVHSAVAAQQKTATMLSLLALPAGATASATAPSLALQQGAAFPAADPSAVVDSTQWWTVPGTDAQLSAYLQSLAVPGFSSATTWQVGPHQPALTTYYQPGLAYYADASLAVQHLQDGNHVDVQVDAYVIWLAPRTPVERIPAGTTRAVLDYHGATGQQPVFGGSDTTPKPKHAHKAVTGSALRRLIRDLNAAPADGPWERGCPAGSDEKATLTLQYAARTVRFTTGGETCLDIDVTADGKAQPTLTNGYAMMNDVYAALGVVSTPIPRVPPQGPPVRTPAPMLTVLEHNTVQAERVGDRALYGYGLYAPGDSRLGGASTGPPRPAFQGPGHFVDRAWFYTITGTREQLVAWFRAYAPKGYVAAEPVTGPRGVRLLVLEPRDRTKPVSALIWISMMQRGKHVAFRIDAQTAWLPKPS